MHELSIAQAVVAIACEHAGGRRVTKVELRVGHLRQVVPSALAFSFELVAGGTVAEGAELEIVQVPVRTRCRDCGASDRQEDFPLRCTRCGSLDAELLEGEELDVEALELEVQDGRAVA